MQRRSSRGGWLGTWALVGTLAAALTVPALAGLRGVGLLNGLGEAYQTAAGRVEKRAPAAKRTPATKKTAGGRKTVAAKKKTLVAGRADAASSIQTGSWRSAGGRAAVGRPLKTSAPLGARKMASRYRVRVDPAMMLELSAQIATTLADGATAISYPGQLANFYRALLAHEQDPESPTVRAIQFGDSHTAADMFTGEARQVLQRQFGNGGIGYSYAGHPFAGYRIVGSGRSQSGGWVTQGTHFRDLGDAMLGMGGVSIETARQGETVTLDAPCTTLEVQYLAQPGGGTVSLTDDGVAVAEISTASAVEAPGTYRGTCAAGDTGPAIVDSTGEQRQQHHFVLTTESGASVKLLGMVALEPGVTWEAVGINGAEAPLMLRWDPTLFAAYLKDTAAALVVLAYGTNEAAARWDGESYREAFGRLVRTIHQLLPEAAVLVIGPSDRSVSARGRGFAPFEGTARIIEAQREVCRADGCAFWDQRQRMGGLGAMQRWAYAGWAQPDHTHFTGKGYQSLADALMADLLSGYEAYRAVNGPGLKPLVVPGISLLRPTAAGADMGLGKDE